MKVLSMTAGVLLLGGVLVGTGFGQQQSQSKPKQPMEVLRGGPGDDMLIGTDQRELLIGGSGEDVLRGGGGADILEGGPGDDQLEAWSFEDYYDLEGDDDGD